MKKLTALLLVFATIFMLGNTIFANDYTIVGIGENLIIQKEIPSNFTYDKTCYRATKDNDNNYIFEYLGKADKDWVKIDFDTYVKKYEERNSLGITY